MNRTCHINVRTYIGIAILVENNSFERCICIAPDANFSLFILCSDLVQESREFFPTWILFMTYFSLIVLTSVILFLNLHFEFLSFFSFVLFSENSLRNGQAQVVIASNTFPAPQKKGLIRILEDFISWPSAVYILDSPHQNWRILLQATTE